MADLRQIVFSQTGYFHDGIATESVVQHSARDIQSDLTGVFVDHCIDVTFSKASGAPPKLDWPPESPDNQYHLNK